MSDQVYIPRAGLNSVGNYQVSGIPYATSSVTIPAESSPVLKISFPSVTREVVVKNTGGASINLGFSENGLLYTNNYVTISGSESFSAAVKVTDIYLISATSSTTTADIFAGLTGIGREMLPTNWSGSVGVG